MLWLPDALNIRWRLPLSDPSAAALLSAKVTSDESSLTMVRGAVEHDAALSLWAACTSAADGHDDLCTADALANWLVANQRRVLVWPGAIHQTPDEPVWQEQYRRLSGLSLAVAWRARHLAGEGSDIAERAFLLGLLHLAGEWWALDREPGPGDVPPPGLPAWLSAALDELFCATPLAGAEIVRYVAQARQECDEAAALAEYDRLTTAGPLAISALSSAARCLPCVENALHFDERLTAAKLAAMAEFAAGAGHEINNPIAVICGRAQLLLEGETNPQRRHELAVINNQAMRVYEMISDMMLFARPPEPKLARCDVVAVARQVVEELLPVAGERQLTMHFEHVGESFEAVADARQLAVVMRALCENALASAPRGGYVIVGVERRSAPAGGPCALLLTVADNGPGMTDHVREHLFDPFFSGREAGRGLGMGLAKAWRIVNNHGGQIEVQSSRGEGAKFTVVLWGTGN